MRKLFVLFGICFLMCSCQSEENLEPADADPQRQTRSEIMEEETPDVIMTDSMMKLGAKLENPYSVANMREALLCVASSTRAVNINENDIQTTHYYVRFHPKTEEELALIKQDTTLILYEYPLDYEIEQYGTCYHSPDIPDSLPTYQYASIKVAEKVDIDRLPVEYEILENLFIPDEEEAMITPTGKRVEASVVESLLSESFRITDNTLEAVVATRGGRWQPSGRIWADDNLNGPLPLVHVRVRARRWYTTHIGYTDRSGFFLCNGTFKRPANYSIVWESDRWDIRDGNIVQALYNGPKMIGFWDVYLDSGKSLRYATIHRALYRYYYGDTDGLMRPSNARKEKIAYHHKDGGINGDYNDQWGAGVWSDIRIYGATQYGWREMSELFSTTCHELGHASHYTNSTYNYKRSSRELLESWARCVQFTLTNREYEELGLLDELNQKEQLTVPWNEFRLLPIEPSEVFFWVLRPDYKYNFQRWYKGMGLDAYTPLFIDLIDSDNQQQYYRYSDFYKVSDYYKFPNDRIFNIPIPVIGHMVFSSQNFADIKQKLLLLVNNPPGPLCNLTTETINQMFEVYEN